MNRRAFLTTTMAAATAASMKAASAATVTPFGQTGAPLRATEPLPLGPLSDSVIRIRTWNPW
jgi:gluconolactonase